MDRPAATLHIGQHRTGTTSVQALLAAVQPDLAAHDIHFVPRFDGARLRADYTPFRRLTERSAVDVAEEFRGRQSSLSASRLVLSDEGLLNPVIHNNSGQLYPKAVGRIQGLTELAEQMDLKIVVTFRHPVAIARSWFAHSISMGKTDSVAGYQRLMDQLQTDSAGMFTACAAAFGDNFHPLMFDDLMHDRPKFLSALLAALPDIPIAERSGLIDTWEPQFPARNSSRSALSLPTYLAASKLLSPLTGKWRARKFLYMAPGLVLPRRHRWSDMLTVPADVQARADEDFAALQTLYADREAALKR